MAIESAQFIADLNAALPGKTDWISEGDDHLRLLKAVLLNTLINAEEPLDLAYVARALPPIGSIIMFAEDTPPDGWVLCDGATHDRSDGQGTITVPDLRDKFIAAAGVEYTHADLIGADTKVVTSTNAGSHGHTGTVGLGGAHSHSGVTGSTSLTIAQLPAHNHGGGNHTHQATDYVYGGADRENNTGSVSVGYLNPAATTKVSGASGNIANLEGSNQGHSHIINEHAGHAHSLSAEAAGEHAHNITVDVRPRAYVLTFICKI
jgi:microcystin-dependent protein